MGLPSKPTQDVSTAFCLLLMPNLSRHGGAGLLQRPLCASPCTLLCLCPLQTPAKITFSQCKSFKRLKTLPCLPLSHRIKSSSLDGLAGPGRLATPPFRLCLVALPLPQYILTQGPSPLCGHTESLSVSWPLHVMFHLPRVLYG